MDNIIDLEMRREQLLEAQREDTAQTIDRILILLKEINDAK